MSRDENQNYREYSIPSPASLSPGPYSPEPPLSPDRKVEKRLSSSTHRYTLILTVDHMLSRVQRI